jgi:putative endonuclease
MTIERQLLGKSGEELAVAELERRGYAILDRRYRTARGEIDIIARDGETIVFVEVKMRATAEFGEAIEAVTRGKRRRLARMALDYVARRGLHDRPCRFDVVGIDPGAAGPRITVIAGAFTTTD